MSEVTMMRIPNQLIQRLLKLFPELAGEDDCLVVRVGLNKLLMEKEEKQN